ncbi:TraC family protein [Vibrio harveyi]|uniref:TraC family protein n=1 Tax=Vibrio harveyi TaxID=669 RepID=UPI003D70FFBB
MNLKSFIDKLKAIFNDTAADFNDDKIPLRDMSPLLAFDESTTTVILEDAISRGKVLTVESPYIGNQPEITDYIEQAYSTVPILTLDESPYVIQEYLYTESDGNYLVKKAKLIISRRITEKNSFDEKFDSAIDLNGVANEIKAGLEKGGFLVIEDNFTTIVNWLCRFHNVIPKIFDGISSELIDDEITDLIHLQDSEMDIESNSWKVGSDYHRFLRFGGLKKSPNECQFVSPVPYKHRTFKKLANAIEEVSPNSVFTRTIVFSKLFENDERLLSSGGVYIKETSQEAVDLEQKKVITLLARHRISILKDNHDGLSLRSYVIHSPLAFKPTRDVIGCYQREMYVQHIAKLSFLVRPSTITTGQTLLELTSQYGHRIGVNPNEGSILVLDDDQYINHELIDYEVSLVLDVESHESMQVPLTFFENSLDTKDFSVPIESLNGETLIKGVSSDLLALSNLYDLINKCLRINTLGSRHVFKIEVNEHLWSNALLVQYLDYLIGVVKLGCHILVIKQNGLINEQVLSSSNWLLITNVKNYLINHNNQAEVIESLGNSLGALITPKHISIFKKIEG